MIYQKTDRKIRRPFGKIGNIRFYSIILLMIKIRFDVLFFFLQDKNLISPYDDVKVDAAKSQLMLR